MANTDGLPFEIGIEKAKSDIVNAIGEIGKRYSIPSSIMTMILQSVVEDSKLNTYSSILAYYDISNPNTSTNQEPDDSSDIRMDNGADV